MKKEEFIKLLENAKDNPIKIIKCGDIEIPVEYLKQTTVAVNGDDYIRVQQENKILKERIEYLERSNNRREDTILEQRQEISDLEDNWNKLKKAAKNHSDIKKECYNGELWFEIDDLLNKMQELEGSDSNG